MIINIENCKMIRVMCNKLCCTTLYQKYLHILFKSLKTVITFCLNHNLIPNLQTTTEILENKNSVTEGLV